jgi:DNA ligase-1
VSALADLVALSTAVRSTASRTAKADAIAAYLRRLPPADIRIAVPFLIGATPRGRIGLGPALLAPARGMPAEHATLTLEQVAQDFDAIASTRGAGAAPARAARLAALFARATAAEQDFLTRLAVGELRQGALEGAMVDAIARAAGVPVDTVRRAAMFAGDLAAVAQAALTEGLPGLGRFAIEVMRPVSPMLASPADGLDSALHSLGRAALEWKLDGARIQAHKAGDTVRVFTRNLNDVTEAVPEVVEAVAALPPSELVLDGEAIALGPGGTPQPFQVTMRRFGRKLDVAALRAQLPLAPFFFDLLRRDGESLVDRPAAARHAALAAAAPARSLVPRLVTAELAAAERFLADALAHGHEGVMAKSLDSRYEAGSRGVGWLKVKRTHTLDLVVLAAEWGHGRRKGRLSNLHLGARDPSGGFVMLGKTFKGLTDAMLEWQTRELLAREIARDAWTVYVRPELVVEIAFNDVQASPQYPGGVALRFARVKAYRPDKRAEAADTIDTVRAIYAAQSRA